MSVCQQLPLAVSHTNTAQGHLCSFRPPSLPPSAVLFMVKNFVLSNAIFPSYSSDYVQSKMIQNSLSAVVTNCPQNLHVILFLYGFLCPLLLKFPWFFSTNLLTRCIKFQLTSIWADSVLRTTMMFLVLSIGALTLLPSLCSILLGILSLTVPVSSLVALGNLAVVIRNNKLISTESDPLLGQANDLW